MKRAVIVYRSRTGTTRRLAEEIGAYLATRDIDPQVVSVGRGPVRTGVTVVVPHDGDPFVEPVFAGCHRLNGNGELTGLEWIRESGFLTSPIAITNTHSVGVVRDALIAHAIRHHPAGAEFWSLPVVGETYDGVLNDMNGFHVRAEHLDAALDGASAGPVAEGAVGGGTGMICHEFKGGIGTASRTVTEADGGWSVGALVQANYGSRELLRIDGVPIGEAIPTSDVPSPWDAAMALARAAGTGGAAAAGPAPSSWSWPRTRRSSPTSASGWRSGPGSGSPGWAESDRPAQATSSSRSPPAIVDSRRRRSSPTHAG